MTRLKLLAASVLALVLALGLTAAATAQSDEKIVLGNRVCPFGEKVLDRPSLCMMTSNVFGVITAENLGYAKVAIDQSIARGDAGCRIVVYLQPTEEAQAAQGREYFQS